MADFMVILASMQTLTHHQCT